MKTYNQEGYRTSPDFKSIWFLISKKKFQFNDEKILSSQLKTASQGALWSFPQFNMQKKWDLKFFSRIWKLDLDIIWDHDRYVKAFPGSTLQDSNNGVTISDDLGRKSGILSANNEIGYKKLFWDFFEKYRKSMSRSKISLWYHSESIEHIRNMFVRCWLKRRFWKNEFFS